MTGNTRLNVKNVKLNVAKKEEKHNDEILLINNFILHKIYFFVYLLFES